MAPRNPAWTREELILALDLYFRCDPIHTSQHDPLVVELSEVLNSLPSAANREDVGRFRNPNGVYMKLCNFLRFDPSYEGVGLRRGAKLEESIWNEFAQDRHALASAVAAIKQDSKGTKNSDDPDTVVSHSWRVVSPNVAIKSMDKSAFLHGGTGVPKETRPFFRFTNMTPGDHKGIFLRHSGQVYDTHFHVDVTGTRLRLFWSAEFTALIHSLMPTHHEDFSKGLSPAGETPELRFFRDSTATSTYEVSFIFPDEVTADIDIGREEEITGREEGGARPYYGTRYERDPANRRRAIEIHGFRCQACGFDFERFYGSRGSRFIEVHHTKPLHSLAEKQVIDPANDLVALCSNCHRMIHRRKDDILSVDDLRSVIECSSV